MSQPRGRLPAPLARDIIRLARDFDALARERLRSYVLAESPTGESAALAACAALVEAGYADAGGRVTRIPSPGGDHILTSWGPDDADGHVLLVGHYDTVWPVGQLAVMPYRDDGATIAGPGVFDMKGALVVAELALRVLDAAGVNLRRAVRALIVSDEEVGSPHGATAVAAHLDGAIAVLGLEMPHLDGALKTGRLGSTRLLLSVGGREAHAAAAPDVGVSAIDELLDQLAACRAAVPADGSVMFNVGRIEGGTRANVVAGAARAEIGLRFSSPDVERDVLATLRGLRPCRPGASVRAEVLSRRPTWAPRAGDPLLAVVGAVGDALGVKVDGRPAAGAGDTNLPGSLGLSTLDGFGPEGRGAHARDESIVAASLARRAALLAGVLAALAGGF